MLAKGLAEEVRTFKNNPNDALVPARIRSLVCLALIEVVSIVGAAHPRAAMGMVAAAKSFLREHHADPIKMDELAAYLGFSRARMFAIFKKATGLSPNDSLQRYRIERAREQLWREEVSIADVALSTGFESSQYFSRVFRKYCGITPTEFREQGCAS